MHCTGLSLSLSLSLSVAVGEVRRDLQSTSIDLNRPLRHLKHSRRRHGQEEEEAEQAMVLVRIQ